MSTPGSQNTLPQGRTTTPGPSPAVLIELESNVTSLALAMQHANTNLAALAQTQHAKILPTASNTTNVPTQLANAIESAQAEADAQKREAFEAMRTQWVEWGRGTLKTVEEWLGAPGVGIADRVTLIGLADRLRWYGVRSEGDQVEKEE